MFKKTKEKTSTHRHPIRWWWIGLSLAAILWLGSGIYRERIQPFDEIEYASDMLNKEEIATENQRKDKNHRLCQYIAISIALGSLVIIVIQLKQKKSRG